MVPPCASKPRPATLHVDVGPVLKQAVTDAASAAGVRPSDWVRDVLQCAVGLQAGGRAPEHADGDARADPSRRTDMAASAPGRRRAAADIRLDPQDVGLLDDIVRRTGFRSRTAALRYLLRVLDREAGVDAVDALAQLPRTIPALTDSNVALQRLLNLLRDGGAREGDPAGRGAAGVPAIDVETLQAHVEAVSRVIAALRPLLVIRPVA